MKKEGMFVNNRKDLVIHIRAAASSVLKQERLETQEYCAVV